MNGNWKLRSKTASRGAGPGDMMEEERVERHSMLYGNALPMIGVPMICVPIR